MGLETKRDGFLTALSIAMPNSRHLAPKVESGILEISTYMPYKIC